MKILFCFFYLSSLMAADNPNVDAVRQSLRTMLTPILSKNLGSEVLGKSTFTIKDCEKANINWKKFLLFQEEFKLNLSFKEGCDVEGSVSPRPFSPFPAKLKVRNLYGFKELEMMNKMNSTLETNPVITLTITDGVLIGPKGKVRFEADYDVRIDPMNRENPVKEDLGGTVRINQVFGQKVSIKEKIYLK
jgi:hypothetical protein